MKDVVILWNSIILQIAKHLHQVRKLYIRRADHLSEVGFVQFNAWQVFQAHHEHFPFLRVQRKISIAIGLAHGFHYRLQDGRLQIGLDFLLNVGHFGTDLDEAIGIGLSVLGELRQGSFNVLESTYIQAVCVCV
jgi:hypothetical protein